MSGLKKYQQLFCRNLLSFLISDIAFTHKRSLNISFASAGIENYIPLVSQFLYLFLLTKNQPFMARKHPSKKKYRFGESVGETAKFSSYVNHYKLGDLLKKLQFKLMRRQISPEKSAIKFDHKYIKIIVWNAPLTPETNCLQINQNAFLADIPIYYKFRSQKLLAKEIAFWVKFNEFLKPNTKNT